MIDLSLKLNIDCNKIDCRSIDSFAWVKPTYYYVTQDRLNIVQAKRNLENTIKQMRVDN